MQTCGVSNNSKIYKQVSQSLQVVGKLFSSGTQHDSALPLKPGLGGDKKPLPLHIGVEHGLQT